MKRSYMIIIFATLAVTLLMLTSCSHERNGFVDGYYTAEDSVFDSHGWKEYITICVSGGNIVTVEYNAKNSSGMIKSWDMNYMRTMNRISHSYPNQYTRAYGGDLLKNQSADEIDAITGATGSYGKFLQLADAVLGLAKEGKTQIAAIEIVENE